MSRPTNRFINCAVVLTIVTLIAVVYNRQTEWPANQTPDSARTRVVKTGQSRAFYSYPSGKIIVGVFVLINVGIGEHFADRGNSTNSRWLDDQELGLGNCDEVSVAGEHLFQ